MKLFVRPLLGVLLSLSFLTAQAAHAGTAYVPLPGITTLGPISYETQVTVTNGLAQDSSVSYLQLGTAVDGTLRQGLTSTPLNVSVSRTSVLKPSASAMGLLELTGPVGFQFGARLVGSGTNSAGLGAELPVITSDTMGLANKTLVVQGLKSGGATKADFVIINLGQAAATCTARVTRADGSAAISTVQLSLLPLSHNFYPNVFAGEANGIADARVEVTCSDSFYAFAQMSNTTTGEISYATPSGSSDSTLTPPGSTPPPSGDLACAAAGTSVCYVFPGLVHTSTLADPDQALILTPPVFSYSSVKVHMEIQVNGFQPPSIGGHELLYMIRNRNKDEFANIFLRGPSRNTLTLRHGFHQTSPEKPKIERGFIAQIGATYALDYDYDPVHKTIILHMSQNGQLLLEILATPNVNRVQIETGDRVIVGLSNPGNNPTVEPASIGWKYSNIKVEFFR
jgi:hypothetical protein